MRRCALALLLTACAEPAEDPFGEGDLEPPFRFDVAGGFWDAPLPSDHRVRDDTRRVDLSAFPAPDGVAVVDELVGLLDDRVQGWSLTGAVHLPLARAIDTSALPTVQGSLEPDARVFLVDVHESSPDRGRRHPVQVEVVQGDAYGPELSLAVRPVPGVPLAPRRRYAVVVDRAVTDADGFWIEPSPALAALVAGEAPEGWRPDVADQYLDALRVLQEDGVDLEALVGLAVFTTGRPVRDLLELVDHARAGDMLRVIRSPQPVAQYDDFCLVEVLFDAPVYAPGAPPWEPGEGTFAYDEDGVPVEHERVRGRALVSVPRLHGTQGWWPTVLFVRDGAGVDRPLIDLGAEGEEEGAGYAADLARVGWASVQLDGPHGGPYRNPAAEDEGAVLDLAHFGATRDHVRQAALELALASELLDRIHVRPPTCGLHDVQGVHYMRLDRDDLVLFGHGTGAALATLAAAVDPAYRALILSGAGGSWAERVLHDDGHREAFAGLLGVDPGTLGPLHPALTLLQWAGEPADPPAHAHRLSPPDDPARWPHVLLFQDVPDPQAPPPVAHVASLSLGLDLAGDALDAGQAEPLASRLGLVGGRALGLPAGLNRAAGPERNVTRVVVQHPGEGGVFQHAGAREQVRCFLEGLLDGGDKPLVAAGDGTGCPAPPSAEAR